TLRWCISPDFSRRSTMSGSRSAVSAAGSAPSPPEDSCAAALAGSAGLPRGASEGPETAPPAGLVAVAATPPVTTRPQPSLFGCRWGCAFGLLFRFHLGCSLSLSGGSALDVLELLQHLVRGRDRLRVRLERTLVGDQVDELLRDVHVRLLERARGDRSAA